jgi:pantetheine-phosphate adenylyltransferase
MWTVATLRGERELPRLATYVIDVISGETDQDLAAEEDSEKLRTAKMSSTSIRAWIAKRDR